MNDYIATDTELLEVLSSADEADLAILADFITDNDRGRIALDSAVRSQISAFKNSTSLRDNVGLLAKEIQEFGGNSIINFFRRKGVPYRDILEDVARHMKVSVDTNSSIEDIETRILVAVALKGMEKMSADEQSSFLGALSNGKITGLGPATMGLQTYILGSVTGRFMLSTTVANAVAKQLVGRGLAIAPTFGASRLVAAFAGPIGWAITAVWAAFDMASPAYRVTVPCVIQIAYMRQKALCPPSPPCRQCGSPAEPDAKYCSKCGAGLDTGTQQS